MFVSLTANDLIAGSGETAAQARAVANRHGLAHAQTRPLTKAETHALATLAPDALRVHPRVLGLAPR